MRDSEIKLELHNYKEERGKGKNEKIMSTEWTWKGWANFPNSHEAGFPMLPDLSFL